MTILSEQQHEYSEQRFQKLAYKNTELANKEFYNCTFLRCSFRETLFRNCTFQGCTFEDCDLSLVKVDGSSFTNVRFEGSQVIGVNWTLASWARFNITAPISFSNCAINYSTFIGLKLRETRITECIAREVDFSDADLTGADCSDTDFSSSRFSHTDLTNANFEGARHYSIDVNTNILKKTRFSLPEAVSLLYSLDIVLVE